MTTKAGMITSPKELYSGNFFWEVRVNIVEGTDWEVKISVNISRIKILEKSRQTKRFCSDITDTNKLELRCYNNKGEYLDHGIYWYALNREWGHLIPSFSRLFRKRKQAEKFAKTFQSITLTGEQIEQVRDKWEQEEQQWRDCGCFSNNYRKPRPIIEK